MKKQLFDLPHSLFLLTAVTAGIIPIFLEGQSEVVHLFRHTIFLTSPWLMWLSAFIFLLGWIIYQVTGKLLLKTTLTWIHVLLTIFMLYFLLVLRVWTFKYPSDKLEVILYKLTLRNNPREIKVSLLGKTMFIMGQFTYVVNIIGGIIKRRKTGAAIVPSQ